MRQSQISEIIDPEFHRFSLIFVLIMFIMFIHSHFPDKVAFSRVLSSKTRCFTCKRMSSIDPSLDGAGDEESDVILSFSYIFYQDFLGILSGALCCCVEKSESDYGGFEG